MNRRKFLYTLGMALGIIGLYSPRLFYNRKSEPIPLYNGKRLILIHLNGGNDGLYALAPKSNDIIDSRRKVMMGELYKGIEWERDFLLNNKLSNFADLAQKGWLSIIPNVGYPKQSTSHIISERVWESGFLPGEESAKTGWFGRLIDENKLSISDYKNTAISFTSGNQLIYNGRINQGVYWNGKALFETRLRQLVKNNYNDFNNHKNLFNELENHYRLQQLLDDIKPYPGYPKTRLGNDLAIISSIIKKHKPFKVFHLMHGGYDTHQGQIHRLSTLYNDLASSLRRFAHDLNTIQEWKNTQILIYSEFGRSIGENSTGGTDHGYAGPVFVMGGDQIYGDITNIKPIYEPSILFDSPILKYQIDFRDIFSRVIDHWLT